MFASYVHLSHALLENVTGVCLFNGRLESRGQSGRIDVAAAATWIGSLGWTGKRQRTAVASALPGRQWVIAMPLQRSDGSLLGVFCVRQRAADRDHSATRWARSVDQRLKPVLDSLHRELVAAAPKQSKLQTLTERTAELEWLFTVTTNLNGSCDDRHIVADLLNAATERLKSALGALCIPDRNLSLECDRTTRDQSLRQAWEQTRPHLISWAQRQRRPLVLNGAGRANPQIGRCKILSAPVLRDTGEVIGVLAFFNPAEAADYENRQMYLGRHLGRQVAQLVEAQFDLMTGLYTRGGLEQMYTRLAESDAEHSVIYVDVDHMHMINELHGFELGNELIIRIAELLRPPLLPQEVIAARVAGDRFAIVLPSTRPEVAAQIAEQLQARARSLVIGPEDNPVETSMSCGITTLVNIPQGLARAIAAAEVACRTAKARGRNRVEIYSCDDRSMLRPREDALAVGHLRAALKENRILLYAQPIVPLQDPGLPGGYEILMRLRDKDGELVSPAGFIEAAHRYQLLVSLDRWITQRALQMLAPYRNMLKSRGISLSINVSGQSIGDYGFVQQITAQLASIKLPPGSIIVEITEQAAVRDVAKTNELIQPLRLLGCRFALDDFGTGANSLSHLKTLQIARLKIDGSFVRDLATNKLSHATVRGIVELAKGLGLDTVAEYVESQAIAQILKELGVDYAQGYAFGEPVALDGVLNRLAQEESGRLRRLFLEI